MEESAEMAEAAEGWRARGGGGGGYRGGGGDAAWVGGGWLQRNGNRGLLAASSPLAHPARTVFPLAKSQSLYRSRSDPPNWLLMTP